MDLQKSSSLRRIELKEARVVIVRSRFNPQITDALMRGAMEALKESGLKDQVSNYQVPGAFEIPVALRWLLEKGRFDGAIALGAVIRGDTPHFDYVCHGVTEGILRVQLDSGIPIAFGVLTTDTIAQALERTGPGVENKGYEAAQVLLEMIDLKRKIYG